jgi:FtsZ-interacting cell division protein ZipA
MFTIVECYLILLGIIQVVILILLLLKRKKKEKKPKSDSVSSKKDIEDEPDIDFVIESLESDRRQKERVNIPEVVNKVSSIKKKTTPQRTKKNIESDMEILNKVLQ